MPGEKAGVSGMQAGHDPHVNMSAGASTVDSAAAELYAAPPEEFTDRRKALAEQARAAGDREAARQITALRKPTRAAWVVNQLVRAAPGAPGLLADLAGRLRAAEQARDGRLLRELSGQRRALLDDLTTRAFAAAGPPDPPPALRDEVTGTLAAALADPEVAADFAAGTMTRAATWSGFGLAAQLPDDSAYPGAPPGPDAPSQGMPGPDGPEATAPVPLPPQAPRSLPPQRSRGAAQPAGGGRSAVQPDTAQAPARAPGRPADFTPAPVSRLAPRRAAPGQADAPPRSPVEDAERALATASAAAAAAAAAEELLEDRVRDLEQQLTKARAHLADARLRARHAESAERKARQALNRLQSSR
jgi:hypothetical protein